MHVHHPILSSTIAIIACGGQSSRMGTDKSLISYHQKPQRYHLYDMLQPLAEKVILSVNSQQTAGIPPGYDYIEDQDTFKNAGPLTALLSGFTAFPHTDILLIGCDYPLLTTTELNRFVSNLPYDKPLAFYNENTRFYEPLLAWYPFGCFASLLSAYSNGQHSLQRFLVELNAEKYLPEDTRCLLSADTPGDTHEILSQINEGPGQFRTFDT